MDRKISAIKAQKRNRERVSIYLDGEYTFGLARIVAAWLQVGQELSEEKISELRAEDAVETANLQAMKFLNYRERSEAEVRQYLTGRDVHAVVIDEVIARLQSSSLVDDRRFAINWVENRIEFRPRGRRALAHELQQKGISRDIIQEILDKCNDEVLAYRAALKHSKKLENLKWAEFRKKMFNFLARRGFSYEITAPIVARIWEEINLRKTKELSDTNIEVDA